MFEKLMQDYFVNLTGGNKGADTDAGGANKHLLELQADYYRKQTELWMSMLASPPGKEPAPVIEAERGDRRFNAPEWNELPFFNYLKQSYLLNSRWLLEMVETNLEKNPLDKHAKEKALFFTHQLIDSLSPSNFPATNPEVLKLALETKGASVTNGMKNFRADMEKGRISMTDENAFEVGKNIAISPGAVVFQNDIMQLIQYAPLTKQVHQLPLLMVPPFINKYYILDLQPENSFVRHAVEQGQTVFMVSWRNIPPQPSQSQFEGETRRQRANNEDSASGTARRERGSRQSVADEMGLGTASWDDYIEQGIFQPIKAVLEISGTDQLNALGFCVGGTLLATALAVMRRQKKAFPVLPVASLTLLATFLDFSDVGKIEAYIDEDFVQEREVEYAQGGVVDGRKLASTFASLRANDLIWSYVVNNYLKGKQPEAFDLLYWNSDSTNLPGTLHAYYLRNMYLENNLRVPDKLTLCGVPVDLGKINLPTFILASKEDHIVPWKTAYANTRLLKGKLQFVLAASGHIAGVVNSASKNRRNYWASPSLTEDPEQWLAGATSVPGSWWNNWSTWLGKKSGKKIPARKRLGNAAYPEIEAAPGSYVKVRY